MCRVITIIYICTSCRRRFRARRALKWCLRSTRAAESFPGDDWSARARFFAITCRPELERLAQLLRASLLDRARIVNPDGHPLFVLIKRPPEACFHCVQRLSTALVLEGMGRQTAAAAAAAAR